MCLSTFYTFEGDCSAHHQVASAQMLSFTGFMREALHKFNLRLCSKMFFFHQSVGQLRRATLS